MQWCALASHQILNRPCSGNIARGWTFAVRMLHCLPPWLTRWSYIGGNVMVSAIPRSAMETNRFAAGLALIGVLFLSNGCICRSASAQDGLPSHTLAGTWDIQYRMKHLTMNQRWHIHARGGHFEAVLDEKLIVFAPRESNSQGEKVYHAELFMPTVKKDVSFGSALMYLSPDGQHFRGELTTPTDQIGVLTATRTPPGLYLQAGTATVRSGQKVSIPIYLRDGGEDPARQLPANMNFSLSYRASVARAIPHPHRERHSPSDQTREPPDVPRGNLLKGNELIAGNLQQAETVLVGFAGKSGVRPGQGKPGDTVTEVYFEATGKAGDMTPLDLEVTQISDVNKSPVPIKTVSGWIRIVDSHCAAIKVLDAYRALLMSTRRLTEERLLDVNRDGSVTSRDATLILQMVGRVSGEIPGGKDCSGGYGGVGPQVTVGPGHGTGSTVNVPGSGPGSGGGIGRPTMQSGSGQGHGTDSNRTLPKENLASGSGQRAPVASHGSQPGQFGDHGPGSQGQGPGSDKPDSSRPSAQPGSSGLPSSKPTEQTSSEDDRPPSDERPVTPLDAYRALLMSIDRLPDEQRYDMNADSNITSRDASLILQASRGASP